MYSFSMIIVIIASVLYHISQKGIHADANPFVSMVVTYGVALLISFAGMFLFVEKAKIISSLQTLNWATYLLGISIVALEIGYLLVYRSGWSINVAALFSNVLTAIILIAFGILVYKNQLSTSNIIGIVLSIGGLILMQR